MLTKVHSFWDKIDCSTISTYCIIRLKFFTDIVKSQRWLTMTLTKISPVSRLTLSVVVMILLSVTIRWPGGKTSHSGCQDLGFLMAVSWVAFIFWAGCRFNQSFWNWTDHIGNAISLWHGSSTLSSFDSPDSGKGKEGTSSRGSVVLKWNCACTVLIFNPCLFFLTHQCPVMRPWYSDIAHHRIR